MRVLVPVRRLLPLVAGLALLGCGGESAPLAPEPAPVPTAPATGAESLGAPAPTPTVPSVTAYRVAEESGWLWVDVAALRSMDGWSDLSSQLRALAPRVPELEPLVSEPGIDPLSDVDRLVMSEGAPLHARVFTLEPTESEAARAAADRVAATPWTPVAGAEVAALSTRDDAPTLAVDAEGRVVAAGPGYVRGALRVGARLLDPFWEPETVLAVSFPGEMDGVPAEIEALRLWATAADGIVRVVFHAEVGDPSTLDAMATRVSRRRDTLLQSPVVRMIGLEDTIASAQIVVEGSALRVEATMPERRALTLLGMMLDALSG